MTCFGRCHGVPLLLALLAAACPRLEGAGTFGVGVGLLAGDGGSAAPWSFGYGTRGMYGAGAAVDVSWLFRPEHRFEVRPRLALVTLATGSPVTDGNAQVLAKAHGQSLTCDLLWRFNPASAKPFYLFIGPGLAVYSIGAGPAFTPNVSAGFEFDLGVGMILSRGLEVEFRFSNHAGLAINGSSSAGAAVMGYTGPMNTVTPTDYSPNYAGVVCRKRF